MHTDNRDVSQREADVKTPLVADLEKNLQRKYLRQQLRLKYFTFPGGPDEVDAALVFLTAWLIKMQSTT